MDGLPFQLPTQVGTELFPNVMQSPAILRVSITGESENPMDPQEALRLASMMVEGSSGAIRGFFLGQTQRANLSGQWLQSGGKEFSWGSVRHTRVMGVDQMEVGVSASVLGKELKRLHDRFDRDLFGRHLLAVQFENGKD